VPLIDMPDMPATVLAFNIWIESRAGPDRITEQIMREGRF
jgi:hypothetical protein